MQAMQANALATRIELHLQLEELVAISVRLVFLYWTSILMVVSIGEVMTCHIGKDCEVVASRGGCPPWTMRSVRLLIRKRFPTLAHAQQELGGFEARRRMTSLMVHASETEDLTVVNSPRTTKENKIRSEGDIKRKT